MSPSSLEFTSLNPFNASELEKAKSVCALREKGRMVYSLSPASYSSASQAWAYVNMKTFGPKDIIGDWVASVFSVDDICFPGWS